MLQQMNQIDRQDFVTDIVTKDYRTASVFTKYDIDFCCGGKFSLDKACFIKGLKVEEVKNALEDIVQLIPASNFLKFNRWNLDFLMNYITYTHHEYLKTVMSILKATIREFAKKHREKYEYLPELENTIEMLADEMLPRLIQEEQVIFPYIRQVEHAYKSKETYAGLMVRTLSKPVEEVMKHNHDVILKYLSRIKEITGNYTPPANACLTHKVNFSLLREMEYDLLQHLHLENDILFPKAIAMENELLLQIN